MKYFERVYVEVRRRGERDIRVENTRSRGIDREYVVEYVHSRRKICMAGIIALSVLFGTSPVVYVVDLIMGNKMNSPVLLALVLIALSIAGFFIIRGVVRRYRSLRPEDEACLRESAPDALDWYLKRRHHLNEKHDMISAASVLNGKPHYVASTVNAGSIRWIYEKEPVQNAILKYAGEPGNDPRLITGRFAGSEAAAAQPGVVDLRSGAERETERAAGSALLPDREKLAQEMAAYLGTHDTGNNPEHYREFRTLFHDRSEQIAQSGGCNRALQEIYYRIRFLCRAQGTDFHSGAVGHVFEGEYWKN